VSRGGQSLSERGKCLESDVFKVGGGVEVLHVAHWKMKLVIWSKIFIIVIVRKGVLRRETRRQRDRQRERDTESQRQGDRETEKEREREVRRVSCGGQWAQEPSKENSESRMFHKSSNEGHS
jgi:hypothetical protein